MKRCGTCGKTKPLNEFVDPSKSGCSICAPVKNPAYEHNPASAKRRRETALRHYYDNRDKKRKQVAKYQWDKKLKAIAVLGSVCQICGFDHPAALQFHHRDPSTKAFGITTKTLSTPKKFPWEVILEEIAKCDLLCGNCHAVSHSTFKVIGDE